MSNRPKSDLSNSRLKEQYEQFLMPIWKELSTPIKRANGTLVQDYDGNDYLDLFAGIAVTNAGHANDSVVEAAKAQLDEFVHGCTYVHPNRPAAELGERLAAITPGELQKSFFANSGTEAVEGAIKLARKYTGSKEIIALEMAFHGRTLGSLALTGNRSYKSEMAPTINDVAHVAPPYAYRCQRCGGGPCTVDCADSLERTIETHTSGDLAAVVVEPVMGEGGIIVPPDGWLARIKEITRDHNALLIVDEVQTGYGRTGRMWGVEHFEATPDIMPQAKGIANGLPLGAFTARSRVANAFDGGDHLSTFGGNPVACAAALATIDQLQNGLVDNAAAQGDWMSERLAELRTEYDIVGDVRGLGLMFGIEFVDSAESGPMGVGGQPDTKTAKRVGQDLLEDHSVIVGVGGYHSNVLRLQPPLSISRDELERAIAAIEETITAYD